MPPHDGTTPDRSQDIPEPLRAAAGLAVTVLDQARQLPTAITGLPVRVAGIAMQTSLRLQQRYAGLVVKGDELLTQIRRPDDAEPPWATFDDDVLDVADAATEDVGVDVTGAADPASGAQRPGEAGRVPGHGTADSEVALPPLPGTTRTRPPRKGTAEKATGSKRHRAKATGAATRMGHGPSAFDLAEDAPATSAVTAAPVPGYDDFTLAQLRARLRTFDAATLASLVDYERSQRARTPYITMLENRLARNREQR